MRSNMSNVAHTYSHTEPESGVFAAARKVAPEPISEDSPIGDDRSARLALYEALCVLANAASKLEGL
jgi:hypothetical protein